MTGTSWAQTPLVFEPNPLVRAQKMIDAGEARTAFDLLSTLEADRAGQVDFDYVYGISALDSGQPALAVFALSRAVANDPLFAGARVELARAYLELGEKPAARDELAVALSQNPPPKVRRLVDTLMAVAEGKAEFVRPDDQRTRVSGYLEATAGWDSNANASTSDNNFLGFTLDETAVRASSPFLRGRGGVTVNHRFAPRWSLVGSGNLSHRHNPDASFIDTSQGDGFVGARYVDDRQLIRFGAQGYRVNADSELNNQGGGLTAEWRHLVGEREHVGISGRAFAIRYAETLKIQDVNQVAVGLSYVYRFGDETNRSLVFSALGGRDFAVEDESPYDRGFFGFRATAGRSLTENLSLSGSIGWLYSDYGGPFFGADRSDNRYDGSLTLEWRPWDNWVVQPQLRYTINQSDVSLYEYNRFVGDLTIRREF